MTNNPPPPREPQHPPGASVTGQPDPSEMIEAVLLLRGATAREERTALLDRLASQLPHERKHLERTEYERIHGAREDDIALLRSVTAAAGLVTRRVSRAGRYVRLTGTVRNFEASFGVKFLTMEGPLGSY